MLRNLALHEDFGDLSDTEDTRLAGLFSSIQNERRKGSNMNPRCLSRATESARAGGVIYYTRARGWSKSKSHEE